MPLQNPKSTAELPKRSTSVRQYFEEYKSSSYSGYNEGFWRAYRRLAYRRVASRLGPGPARVLDVGGGALVSLPDLLEDSRVECYHVVDIVDHLSSKPAKLTFTLSDARQFADDYTGPAFDCIIIFGVMMYLELKVAEELMTKLTRLLAPGGCFVIHEPNSRARRVFNRDLARPVDAQPVDVSRLARISGLRVAWSGNYNVRRWRRMLRRFGGMALVRDVAVAIEPVLGGGTSSLYLLSMPGR